MNYIELHEDIGVVADMFLGLVWHVVEFRFLGFVFVPGNEQLGKYESSGCLP